MFSLPIWEKGQVQFPTSSRTFRKQHDNDDERIVVKFHMHPPWPASHGFERVMHFEKADDQIGPLTPVLKLVL